MTALLTAARLLLPIQRAIDKVQAVIEVELEVLAGESPLLQRARAARRESLTQAQSLLARIPDTLSLIELAFEPAPSWSIVGVRWIEPRPNGDLDRNIAEVDVRIVGEVYPVRVRRSSGAAKPHPTINLWGPRFARKVCAAAEQAVSDASAA